VSIDRLELLKTVRLEGISIRGKQSVLVLEPVAPGTGWVWRVAGKDVPITHHGMETPGRRVILRHGKHVFNEFEHVGILRAAGLEDVRIWLYGDNWPPYDGGPSALWKAVMSHVHKDGVRKPYKLGAGESSLPGDSSRWVKYTPTNMPKLVMTSFMEFDVLGQGRMSYEYPTSDLRKLVEARTLGWPPALRGVSRILKVAVPLVGRRWPHHKRILWPQEIDPEKLLEEAGRHRLCDALAILAFAVPKGTYLTGTFHSCKGNHVTDLALVRRIATTQVVTLHGSAA
jgi:UDP-3-O-acyl-N-acetylglucosamine deacetylase